MRAMVCMLRLENSFVESVLSLFCVFWGPNSDYQACMPSIVPTQSSYQPTFYFQTRSHKVT